jgi:hypothetical protein
MSEYVCPLTGEPCLRPGLLGEGYCGGQRPEDGICPKVLLHVKSEFLKHGNDPKNLILEQQSSNTVVARDIKTLDQIRIQSGHASSSFTVRK